MNAARFLPLPRHGADGRTLAFIGLGLLVAAGNWTGIFRNAVSVPLGYLLAFIACTATHNHMHLPVFRSGFWNSIYQITLSFSIGQPPTGIITAHNIRHHNHAESELDFVRTSLVGFRSNALNIVLFPFIAIATMYREKKSDLADWKAKRPRLYRQALIERGVFYSAVIVLLFADWRSTLLFLFLPWIGAQVVLVGMNLLQHQDCDSGSEYDHSRNLTGKTVNFFLLNSGFHTAHHLRPAMHWSKLPAYHEREIAPRMNPSLNHRSLLGLLAERVRRPRTSGSQGRAEPISFPRTYPPAP